MATLRFFLPPKPAAIMISGNFKEGVPVADAWSCDYLEYQFTGGSSGAVWSAQNVLMGNYQKQGYCPKRVHRPCADDEFCNLKNGELRYIPGKTPGNAVENRLLDEFECPEPPSLLPLKDEVLLPLGDGTRFDQRRTFLQASSYNFIINDTSKESPTNIVFPSSPPGFAELSTNDFEIFNVWRDLVTRIENRLNMKFQQTKFSAVLGSDDGWRLDSIWVYDNLPDWTEWNANPDADETGIFVPSGYSLFACESVEFTLESRYKSRGGSDGILRFEKGRCDDHGAIDDIALCKFESANECFTVGYSILGSITVEFVKIQTCQKCTHASPEFIVPHIIV